MLCCIFYLLKNNQEIVFLKQTLHKGYGIKLFDTFNISNRILNQKIFICKKSNIILNSFFPDRQFIKIYPVHGKTIDKRLLSLDNNKNYDIHGPYALYEFWKSLKDKLHNIFEFKKNISDEANEKIKK